MRSRGCCRGLVSTGLLLLLGLDAKSVARSAACGAASVVKVGYVCDFKTHCCGARCMLVALITAGLLHDTIDWVQAER